jgi:hypothetical protein
MRQLGEANNLIELKEGFERENADEISALSCALEEEQTLRTSLEESIIALNESHNLNVSKLVKERDHAIALSNLLKKEKVEFGVGHGRLTEELDELNKAHKALESEFSKLTKSHEQLQIQLAKCDMPSTSSPSCDHAIIIEENARLKEEMAKLSLSQGEKTLNDLVKDLKGNKGKEGLGYVSKAKKKNKKNKGKKKAKPAQAKQDVVGGNATRGKATHNDFAGLANPHYVLIRDYYGDVYAKYVGPYDGYIAWSIWVPKTLVANKRGPIAKWVPKSKA